MSPGCQVLEAPDLTAALCVAVWPKPGTLARSFQSQDGRTRPKVSGDKVAAREVPPMGMRKTRCPDCRATLGTSISTSIAAWWSLPMRCPGTGPAPRTSPRRRSCGHTAIGSASGAPVSGRLGAAGGGQPRHLSGPPAANKLDNSLSRIDPQTNRVVATMAAATAWPTSRSAGMRSGPAATGEVARVVRIDPQTNRVWRRAGSPSPRTSPSALVLYGLRAVRTVLRIDPRPTARP